MFDGLLSAPGTEGAKGQAGAGLRSSSAGACSRESDGVQGRKVTRIDKRKKVKEDKGEKRKSPLFKVWPFKKSGHSKSKGAKGSDRANSADREPPGRKTGGFARGTNKIGIAPSDTAPYIEVDALESDQLACQTVPHA